MICYPRIKLSVCNPLRPPITRICTGVLRTYISAAIIEFELVGDLQDFLKAEMLTLSISYVGPHVEIIVIQAFSGLHVHMKLYLYTLLRSYVWTVQIAPCLRSCSYFQWRIREPLRCNVHYIYITFHITLNSRVDFDHMWSLWQNFSKAYFHMHVVELHVCKFIVWQDSENFDRR